MNATDYRILNTSRHNATPKNFFCMFSQAKLPVLVLPREHRVTVTQIASKNPNYQKVCLFWFEVFDAPTWQTAVTQLDWHHKHEERHDKLLLARTFYRARPPRAQWEANVAHYQAKNPVSPAKVAQYFNPIGTSCQGFGATAFIREMTEAIQLVSLNGVWLAPQCDKTFI